MKKDYDFIKRQPDPELEKLAKETHRKAMLYSILFSAFVGLIVVIAVIVNYFNI